jgi:hypothetical protein
MQPLSPYGRKPRRPRSSYPCCARASCWGEAAAEELFGRRFLGVHIADVQQQYASG